MKILNEASRYRDYVYDGTPIPPAAKSHIINLTFADNISVIDYTLGARQLKNLQTVHIPSTVYNIYPNTFADLSHDVEFQIDEGIRIIGAAAFARSKQLTHLKFPASVGKIGGNAFSSCESLVNVEFDSNESSYVEQIDTEVFCRCKNLKEFAVPPHWNFLPHQFFRLCSGLNTVRIESSSQSPEFLINETTFYGCNNLNWIFSEKEIKVENPEVFSHCPNLTVICPSTENAQELQQLIPDVKFTSSIFDTTYLDTDED